MVKGKIGPRSRFLKLMCPSCNNEQIIFNKASISVKCLVCGEELSNPTGGKANVKTKVVQVL